MGKDKASNYNFRSLEGLRGYMAWAVVVSHAVTLTGLGLHHHWIQSVFVHGSRAVNVFIMLSGFVITHLLVGKAEPYKPYLLRRAMRIIPIYLVCLALALIFMSAQIQLHSLPYVEDHEVYHAGFEAVLQNPVPYALLHMTLLHGVVPDSVLNYSSWAFLGPAWSLSLEWQFYLLAPFLLGLLRKSTATQVVTTVVLLLGYVYIEHFSPWRWTYPSMLLCSIHLFLIGILSRLWFDRLLTTPLWLIFAIYAVLMVVFKSWEIMVWALFLVAAMHECRPAGQAEGPMQRALRLLASNKPILYLGKTSYSTYLVHSVLFSVVVGAGILLGFEGPKATTACIGLAMLLLIPASALLYRFIEKPFITIGARWAGRINKAPAPLLSSASEAVLEQQKSGDAS